MKNDFLEVLVTARFSKMKDLTDSVIKLGEYLLKEIKTLPYKQS